VFGGCKSFFSQEVFPPPFFFRRSSPPFRHVTTNKRSVLPGPVFLCRRPFFSVPPVFLYRRFFYRAVAPPPCEGLSFFSVRVLSFRGNLLPSSLLFAVAPDSGPGSRAAPRKNFLSLHTKLRLLLRKVTSRPPPFFSVEVPFPNSFSPTQRRTPLYPHRCPAQFLFFAEGAGFPVFPYRAPTPLPERRSQLLSVEEAVHPPLRFSLLFS